MATKITKQQLDDLTASGGQPVPVVDEDGHKVYYLVEADYRHASHEQLKALIEQGMNAPHVPAEQAERDLRRYADGLSARNA